MATASVAVGGDFFAELTQHIFARQRVDAVANPAGMPQSQILGRTKNEVGGPFTLLGHPVVGGVHGVVQIGSQGMNRLDQFLQQSGPVGVALFVEQGLGLGRFLNMK